MKVKCIICCLFVQTPGSNDGLALDNVDPVTEAKYREKLFTQVCIGNITA